MAGDGTDRTHPTFASLLSGLAHDMKVLTLQELRLAKNEVQEELGKAKTAAASLAVGIGLAAIGGLLLILMLVHLLQALTDLPLWACYGIVGGLLAGGGVALLLRAKERAGSIHVLPVRTFETIKENVAWIKEEVTSPRT